LSAWIFAFGGFAAALGAVTWKLQEKELERSFESTGPMYRAMTCDFWIGMQ
jgi:hypothetical protein